jgi:hypothetical protein
MDALVYIFLVLILRLGNNYALIITPILFTISSIIWLFINSLGIKSDFPDDKFLVGVKSNYLKSVYLRGKIIFSN